MDGGDWLDIPSRIAAIAQGSSRCELRPLKSTRPYKIVVVFGIGREFGIIRRVRVLARVPLRGANGDASTASVD